MAIYSVCMDALNRRINKFNFVLIITIRLEVILGRLDVQFNFSLCIHFHVCPIFFFLSFACVYKSVQIYNASIIDYVIYTVGNFAVTLQITTPIVMQRSKRRSKCVCCVQKTTWMIL